MTEILDVEVSFSSLGLPKEILDHLLKKGYFTPTPIQERAIPVLLSGHDIIGQAQTGTGKTAAFALPLISQLDAKKNKPQIIVLTPTRELAIQVCDSFIEYSKPLQNVSVVPIYGGADIQTQLRKLKKGVHVIVGTPGRLIDLINRKKIDFSCMKSVVLDEADEMLRMGFIDDVNFILEQLPVKRQTALFSATMPPQIKKIANKHLNEPVEIKIQVKTRTADTIDQRYIEVNRNGKFEVLSKILDSEIMDAVIIFANTKSMTFDIEKRLGEAGFKIAALNGDVSQAGRERIVNQLRSGRINIIVATDVAARGLDVDRISHVINFDLPKDQENYVHRIGRTGRAGRKGISISLVYNKDIRLLKDIEKSNKHKMNEMLVPTIEDIRNRHYEIIKEKIVNCLIGGEFKKQEKVVKRLIKELDLSAEMLAAAFLNLLEPKKIKKLKDELEEPRNEKKKRRHDGSKMRKKGNTRPKDKGKKKKQGQGGFEKEGARQGKPFKSGRKSKIIKRKRKSSF